MKADLYTADKTFILVAEALLSNINCGKTLIRKHKSISRETLNISYTDCQEITAGNYNRELRYLRYITSEEKFKTFICFPPMESCYPENDIDDEITYLFAALKALKRHGRLIIAIHADILTLDYAWYARLKIKDNYCISSIIEIPTSETDPYGLYILEIQNWYQEKAVDYYVPAKYNGTKEMISAIKNRQASFIINADLLGRRWDAKYHDPRFDDLRKKYLSKDTIRLGNLADVITGIKKEKINKQEEGEYLVLTYETITDGEIDYQNEQAIYVEGRLDREWFTESILREGDIIVCISGRIKFHLYHEKGPKVVASDDFCIIRANEDSKEYLQDHLGLRLGDDNNRLQQYLQLYFSTQIGEDNFNLQVQMLSEGASFVYLTKEALSSFFIPNYDSLAMAAKIQESSNLIKKISILFESEGWEVLKEYKESEVSAEFDIALKTQGRIVGVVETKLYQKLDNKDKERIRLLAEKALNIESVEFFIFFMNDEMYRYKNNEFFRIVEIPTPDNYKQYTGQDENYVANAEDTDIKEIPSGSAAITDAYLILSAISDLKQVLGDKIDAVQRTVDIISVQIQELSGRISIYQDLVGRQLEYAKDDLEEQERILKVFTDTCVERVTEKIRSEYTRELYEDEKKKLIDSMGKGAWNKLETDAQNFLISSKVMYSKLVGISEIVDYSGVCLLVTKALELELGKRFCQNYIAYYKTTYPGKAGRENAPLPIINKYHKFIKAHDFTLGSFPFVVGSQFVNGISEADKQNIKDKILEYVKQGVLQSYASSHNDEEILELLSDFVEEVERVRKDYRNPSAHTNALTKMSAKECFDLVLDVEKLLKRMLDAFDE